MARAGEPLATLDRYTAQALTTGQVTLPGRTVHAGAWFRLLRSLLDEVSLALTGRSATAGPRSSRSGTPPAALCAPG